MTLFTEHPQSTSGSQSGTDTTNRGFTLIEVIVTVTMLGLIAAVLAAAITVILRSENGVVRTVAESHDTQQGVNYFPLDVQAGPTATAAYDTSVVATGCVDEGTNLLQFDKGTRRVAYRLTTTGGTARLDRFTCTDVGVSGTPVWSSIRRLNIADTLDTSGGNPAAVQVTTDPIKPALVRSVELRLTQQGAVAVVVASPRAEPRDSPGDCATDSPLAASHGYGAFVEGDVLLKTGHVTGWLGLGGTLRWESNVTVASGNMSGVSPAYGLYANAVDWIGDGIAPAEALEVARGKAALGTAFSQSGDFVYEAPLSTDNYLNLSGSGNPLAEPAGTQIVFAADFDELRDCSAQLARLLDVCAASDCANEVEATVNGSTVNLCTDGPTAQVLNLPEAYWDGTYSFDTSGPGCQGFSQSRPLIINVIDTDDNDEVLINTTPADWTALGDRKNILVNFPDSTHVVVQQGFFGHILAPFAHVETTGDVEGGLVAAQWTHHSGIVTSHNDLYDNPIAWPE
jgi:choice-of-anchor A domain-containing protein/prepilin-type N-terminal cleavage/methylation domain-containing protein